MLKKKIFELCCTSLLFYVFLKLISYFISPQSRITQKFYSLLFEMWALYLQYCQGHNLMHSVSQHHTSARISCRVSCIKYYSTISFTRVFALSNHYLNAPPSYAMVVLNTKDL